MFPQRCYPVAFRSLIGAVAFLVLASTAMATPVKETPWLPETAAYRLTLFLGNLAPVPWDEMEKAWTTPHRGSEYALGALGKLAQRSAVATAELESALATKNLDALHAAATRLIATRIEEELDRAQASKIPAETHRAIGEARELYRAFADHLAAADPASARTIGRAWLELASNAGSAGVLGAGATAPDQPRMDEARQVISDYLEANYLRDDLSPRTPLNAVPETVYRENRAVQLPPTLPPGSDIFDQDPLPRLVLNFEQQGIDEVDLPLIAYGDMLFDSAQIFGNPARELGIACSSCHNRSDINNRFFIPGTTQQPGAVDVDGAFFNPMFNDHRDDPIDIPSLRGLRFTGPYGRDGRFASLRDFARNVIVNEFAGEEPTPFMLDALLAYMLEFDFLPNSRLSADGRLTAANSEAALRGERLFQQPFAGMGGASCATCHQPSANFLDRKAHDIGSVSQTYAGSRTGALDTPTLLGTAYTAPYFHDGSLPTLASVVEWFNDTKHLDLSETERADLTAYLTSVGAADEPYESFNERNTPFRLNFEELSTFASTLDTLLPRRDVRHILLLTDTVAADLAADAATMSNLAARPDVYRLAERLSAVGQAVRAGDWAVAERDWASFKSDAEAVAEGFY